MLYLRKHDVRFFFFFSRIMLQKSMVLLPLVLDKLHSLTFNIWQAEPPGD